MKCGSRKAAEGIAFLAEGIAFFVTEPTVHYFSATNGCETRSHLHLSSFTLYPLHLPAAYSRLPAPRPACVTYSANKPNTAHANRNLAGAGTNEGDRKASMTPATISIGTMPSARRTPCPPETTS